MSSMTLERVNLVLALVIALHDPEIDVQEDAMASILSLSAQERVEVLEKLDSEPRHDRGVKNVSCEVLRRTLQPSKN